MLLIKGINFIDTAEMYSIPGKKETQGSTERFIGSWLKDQKRDQLGESQRKSQDLCPISTI